MYHQEDNMEIAFRVKKDTPLYENFFKEKAEKERAEKLGADFLKENMPEVTVFALCEQLTVEFPSEEVKEQYKSQLKVADCVVHGKRLYTFKKNSAMNKKWQTDVFGQVDKAAFRSMFFWQRDFIASPTFRCRASIWSTKAGEVYGIVETMADGDKLQVPSYVDQIKLSEYYAQLESEYPDKE